MDPTEARKFLGEDFIIGGSANTWDDVKRLLEAEVDYIGIGPYRFTSTKEKLNPELGIQGYKEIIEKYNERNSSIPLIAIGGITWQDISELLRLGFHGVAMAGAINLQEYPQESVKKINKEINNCLKF